MMRYDRVWRAYKSQTLVAAGSLAAPEVPAGRKDAAGKNDGYSYGGSLDRKVFSAQWIKHEAKGYLPWCLLLDYLE